jgi:N-acetylglucosaminyl-diphospho-decaprenol L-rhamnosyltransferase
MTSRAVFVVIVNYRTAALTVECVRAVEAQRAALAGGRVLVVDNCSGDGSVEQIRTALHDGGWGDWVEVLAMPRNGGFAYGNNAGLARALEIDPAFFALVLLNPDAQLAAGALDALIATLTLESDIGIAGALIANPHGGEEHSAHRWPSPLGEFASASQLAFFTRLRQRRLPTDGVHGVRWCDWVSGACIAIRHDVFKAIGALDERYFLYFEEVDFCRRARLAGWRCASVPRARVIHIEGASTGIRASNRRRPAYWYASRRRFFVKAYGLGGLLLGDLLWAFGRSSLLLRRVLRLGGRGGIGREPKGFALDLLGGDLRAALRGELRGIDRMTASHPRG